MRNAFDFGTKQLSTALKDAWDRNLGANHLPPVPAGGWTRPTPINAAAAAQPALGQAPVPDPTCVLTLPHDQLFYRMPSGRPGPAVAPYIPVALALSDFEIDLKECQLEIDLVVH